MGRPHDKKTLKELADDKLHGKGPKHNPTQLGDPASLKAETADSHPTEQDRGSKPVDPTRPTPQTPSGTGNSKVVGGANPPSTLNTAPSGEQETKRQRLGNVAKKTNPTMLGDPVSLKAETADSEPTEEDRGALADKRKKAGSKL